VIIPVFLLQNIITGGIFGSKIPPAGILKIIFILESTVLSGIFLGETHPLSEKS
jgi:hypothetical protein